MHRADVHVVVMTRLNVYMFLGEPNRDRDRLRRRIDVFETWTVPSVVRQVDPPDDWLLLVDEQTHPEDLLRLERILAGTPGRVVLVPSAYTVDEIRALFRTETAADRPWLLTVRLDSDDALGKDYLRWMVAAAEPVHERFYNLRRGYRLAGTRLAPEKAPSNAFLGFVERMDPATVRTTYCCPHPDAATVAPVVQVKAPPSWLVVIHDDNMESRWRGGYAPLRALRDQFGLEPREVRASARRPAAPVSVELA